MITTSASLTPPTGEIGRNPIAADLVTADVAELVVGRSLRFPIYGEDGTLLLAEGVTIAADFARLLQQHKIQSVKLHRDDLSQATFRPAEESKAEKLELDSEIVQKIDTIIDSGLLLVTNSEQAVLNQMTRHGRTNYNRQQYLDRINRNKETSAFVDDLMRNALQGKKVDCSEVTRLTAHFLTDITGDVDSVLASALDAIRQSTIADHSVRMAMLGMALGVELGLDAPNVRNLGLAALVHDWGMVRVPREILDAKRWLTAEERYEITKHPVYTVRLLETTCGAPSVVPLVAYQVHERPNGHGYPQGRAGDRIHLMALILGVADAYCALVSPRPFRPPLIPHAAIECLLRQTALGDYDARVVRALLKVQSLFPIGSYVTLSDGSVARVLRSNGDKYAQPIVRILQDGQGKAVPEDSETAIVDLAADEIEIVQALPGPGTRAVRLNPDILSMEPSATALP